MGATERFLGVVFWEKRATRTPWHVGQLLSPSHCSARLCHLPSSRSVLCQVPGWPGHLLHCPKELTCLSFVNNKDANKVCSWSTIPGAFWKRKGKNLLTVGSVVLTTVCQYCSLHFVLGGVLRVSQVEGRGGSFASSAVSSLTMAVKNKTSLAGGATVGRQTPSRGTQLTSDLTK